MLEIKKRPGKSRYGKSYKGIDLDTLGTIRWYPKVYDDPFRFDYDKVKKRIEDAQAAGFTDDVDTIKRNIQRVVTDNPGVFDDFKDLLWL